MRFQGFIGPSYQQRSVNVDCQRCINLYPEMDEAGTGKEREVMALVSTPGLQTKITIGTTPSRCLYTASNGRVFSVHGNTLYEILSGYTTATIGTLSTNTGTVSIADNGIYLLMVDGSFCYNYQFATSTFTTMDPSVLPACSRVQTQDLRFIAQDAVTGQCYIGNGTLLGTMTFDLTVFVQNAGSADPTTSCISIHRDLWIFNQNSAQVFYASGGTDYFDPIQGAFLEMGLAAKDSLAKIESTLFWLGRELGGTGIVYMAVGYQAKRISTFPVEQAMKSYGDLSTASAYTYIDAGHSFYVLNFPGANTTWVYDMASGLWHERNFTQDGQFQRHKGQWHTYAFGKHLVSDYATGQIYELSDSYLTDDGAPITRQRTAPHITSDLTRLTHYSFQLDCETGVGLDGITQGTNPQVMLKFSDDGGHTWSNEKWVSLGQIGQTKARAIWRRLGSTRDRVYKIMVTDPVRVILIGAELGIEKDGY
jgi:hypothetical protein